MNLKPLTDAEWNRLLDRLQTTSIVDVSFEPDFIYGLIKRLELAESQLNVQGVGSYE